MHPWVSGMLAVFVGLLASSFATAQTVSGVVKDNTGAAVEGVVIDWELDGRTPGETTSGRDGRFSLQFNGVPATSDLALSFMKNGFIPVHRSLRMAVAAAEPLEVALLPLAGVGAVTEGEKRILDPHRSHGGMGPLVFVPYALGANVERPQGEDLNLRLRVQLQRLILTHVQSTVPDIDVRTVAMTPLEINASDDLERLRTFGEYLNALAVVSGMGIANQGRDVATLELSSSFVIIPRADRFVPPVLTIVDEVPTVSIGLASLDQRMSREWGRATVIAMAVRDLNSAQTLAPAQRVDALKRVKRYLIAERSSMGANEALSAMKLKQLLDLIEQDMRP